MRRPPSPGPAVARRPALSALLLLVLLGAAPPARAAGKGKDKTVQGPVAVMPFKNLNEDPDLDWLSVGIAETMISDLRKAGATKVVERAQLDRALAEIALQGHAGGEVSEAARAGRMVGARTIVVGGYQSAGKQLRITARFVEVETGVVVDTAKVTGRATAIFALQDRIVARLLGQPAKGRRPQRRRRPPKTGSKTLKAYRLYAMSLTTASDAQRVSYLRRSLELDPDFVYAAEDLARLRETLAKAEARSQALVGDRLSVLRRDLAAGRLDAQGAVQLMGLELTARRYYALVADAKRILARRWDDAAGFQPRLQAIQNLVNALSQLGQPDLALQAGEAYVDETAGTPYHLGLSTTLNVLIDQQERRQRLRQALPAALAEVKADLAEVDQKRERLEAERDELEAEARRLRAEAQALPPKGDPAASRERARLERRIATLDRRAEGIASRLGGLAIQRLSAELSACSTPFNHADPAGAVTACRAFLERHAGGDEATVQGRAVRFYLVQALKALGRWDEMQTAAAPLTSDPDYGTSVRLMLGQRPADRPEP